MKTHSELNHSKNATFIFVNSNMRCVIIYSDCNNILKTLPWYANITYYTLQ